MNYKLINKATNEEHICSKVVVEGFDYYVSDDEIKKGDWYLNQDNVRFKCKTEFQPMYIHCKKIIATNNSSIDLPQVIDEVEELAENSITNNPLDFIKGYNKSQETGSNSDDDMVAFGDWLEDVCNDWFTNKNCYIIGVGSVTIRNTKELLEIWKEKKQIKTIYYN